VDWIGLAEGMDQWPALGNKVMNLRISENVWKSLGSCATGGFSSLESV
jgi:hypothetical protein